MLKEGAQLCAGTCLSPPWPRFSNKCSPGEHSTFLREPCNVRLGEWPPQPWWVTLLSLLLLVFQAGMIRTEEADYLLTPLPPHLAGRLQGSGQGGPASHVLYKRAVEPQAPRASTGLLLTRTRKPASPGLQGPSDNLGLWHRQHFCGRRKKCM